MRGLSNAANAADHRPRAKGIQHEAQALSRGSVHPLCWATSWPLLLNQGLQLVQMSLLNLNTPEIPLPDNLRVLSVLNQEVTSANAVIVRADEHLSLSALLEQSLLKSLLPDADTMMPQVGVQCRPGLGVVPSNGVLKQELQN